jgi:hypothetical protein
MMRILLGLILAAGIAQAQSTTNPAPPANAPQAVPPTTAVVAPGDAVITLHGLCTGAEKNAGAADANSCATVITKEQYDNLLHAISVPGAPAPPVTRELAEKYVQMLIVSNAAKKAGVENDPVAREYLRLRQIQALAMWYGLELQAQYAKPAPEEIQAYYQKNISQYQQVKLDQVSIPKSDPSAKNEDDFAKRAAAAAADARDRVAKGEDPDQAEKEIYATLGLTSQPGKTDFGVKRRNMFPPDESDDIFSLKPGEVSKIHDEPLNIVFFKVESMDAVPLDQLRDQISGAVAQQNFQDRINEITGSVHADYNDQYFKPSPPPPTPFAPPGAQQGGPSAPAPIPPH